MPNSAKHLRRVSIAQLQDVMKAHAGVTLANINAPDQVVLAGSNAAIEAVQQTLTDTGVAATRLPVSAAFHTPLVAHAQQPFAEALATVAWHMPTIPVYSNTTAQPYPSDPTAIRQMVAEHLLKPVRFQEEIEHLYAAGGRCFVEIGPRNILTNLVHTILGDRPHLAVAMNAHSRQDSDRQWRQAVVQLQVAGLPLHQVDPYQRERQLPETNAKSLLTVSLNGSNYVSGKTKAAFEQALQAKPQNPMPPTTEVAAAPVSHASVPSTSTGTPVSTEPPVSIPRPAPQASSATPAQSPAVPPQHGATSAPGTVDPLPSDPIANFVVRQSHVTLGPPKAFFDSKVSSYRTTKFSKWSQHVRVTQVVVGFDNFTVAVSVSNNE